MRGTKVFLLVILILLLTELGSSWRRRRTRCHRQNCAWRRGGCNRSCGRGWYHFTKIRSNRCGGTCTVPRQRCYLRHCPVNCVVYNWGGWNACSNTCGHYGIQVRQRRIRVAPRWGGRRCPALRQTKRCRQNKEICRWRYLRCSARCGRGRQIFQLVSSNCCGRCKMPVRHCRGRTCPPSCRPTNWGKWSACKMVGSRGIKTRSRKIRWGRGCRVTKQSKVCCRCVWKWGACIRRSSTHGIQLPRLIPGGSCGKRCRRPRNKSCRLCKRRGDTLFKLQAANDAIIEENDDELPSVNHPQTDEISADNNPTKEYESKQTNEEETNSDETSDDILDQIEENENEVFEDFNKQEENEVFEDFNNINKDEERKIDVTVNAENGGEDLNIDNKHIQEDIDKNSESEEKDLHDATENAQVFADDNSENLEEDFIDDTQQLEENVVEEIKEGYGENNEIEYPKNLLDNAEIEIDLKSEEDVDLEDREVDENENYDELKDSNNDMDAQQESNFEDLENDLKSIFSPGSKEEAGEEIEDTVDDTVEGLSEVEDADQKQTDIKQNFKEADEENNSDVKDNGLDDLDQKEKKNN